MREIIIRKWRFLIPVGFVSQYVYYLPSLISVDPPLWEDLVTELASAGAFFVMWLGGIGCMVDLWRRKRRGFLVLVALLWTPATLLSVVVVPYAIVSIMFPDIPGISEINVNVTLISVLGVIFTLVILIIAFIFPNLTPFQYTVCRIILAVSVAGIATLLPGSLEVKLPGGVKAAGALAVFAIIYLKNPAALVSSPTPPADRPKASSWS